MGRIKQEQWDAWEKNFDPTLSIFRLDESREHYGEEDPPFTIKYLCMALGEHIPDDGKRPVIVNLESLNQHFGHHVTIEERETHLALKKYNSTLAFWTLDIGSFLVIVCSKGSQYYPWLGPAEGLSKTTIIGKVAQREWQKPSKKPKERPIHFPGLKISSKPGKKRAASPELDHPNHMDTPATRNLNKRVERNRGQNYGEHSSDEDWGPRNNASKKIRDIKTPRRNRFANLPKPSAASKAATPVKNTEAVIILDTSPAPKSESAEPDISHTWTIEQLKNTTLFLEVSNEDLGSCPVLLRSCLTLDDLFKNGLDIFGLQDKVDKIRMITVKFDWLQEKKTTIVTPKIPDTYQHVLRTIRNADCWLLGGSKECTLQVTFKMMD